MTKTVIVGTNHAGIAAANTLLDNFPDQEVVMIRPATTILALFRLWNSIVGRTSD